MTGPVLLVHDDIALISTVRRLLSRVGHEVVLASSAADAIIAFGHHRPSLVVLSPEVEEGRGIWVAQELRQHPEAASLRLVLLGSPLPDIDAPVAPLPLDGAQFLEQVEFASGDASGAAWELREPERLEAQSADGAEDARDPWQTREPQALGEQLFGDLGRDTASTCGVGATRAGSRGRPASLDRGPGRRGRSCSSGSLGGGARGRVDGRARRSHPADR